MMTLFTLVFSQNVKAGADVDYYGKVTVDVAEDSKGLGTVYILDPSDESHVMEIEGKATDFLGQNGSGANLNLTIINEPAEGYVLSNFTDQNGEVYTYPQESLATDPYSIGVFCTSQSQENPTVFNLMAHFIKKSEMSQEELIEVNVPASEKFGTFMAPVETSLSEDFVAYYVNGVENGMVTLSVVEGRDIPAFTPVLLENVSLFDATVNNIYDKSALPDPLPEMIKGALTGCIEEIIVPEGKYILPTGVEDVVKFEKVPGGYETILDPYRCYLSGPEEVNVDSYSIDVSVGVKNILDNSGKNEIYDAEGRKLNHLCEGINIVNGVKVLVKERK